MDPLDAERRARFVAYFEGPPLRGDRAALMRKTGYTKGRVNHFLDPEQAFGQRAASNLAHRLGLARDAFERSNWTSEQHSDGGTQSGGPTPPVARNLSDTVQKLDPIPIAWESKVSGQLPPVFRVTAQDDAMAPEIRKGQEGLFSTQEGEPLAEDIVLAADRDGNWFMREYRIVRPGHWRAIATASGYDPLDSVEHGLKVLAVYMSRWGRRGR